MTLGIRSRDHVTLVKNFFFAFLAYTGCVDTVEHVHSCQCGIRSRDHVTLVKFFVVVFLAYTGYVDTVEHVHSCQCGIRSRDHVTSNFVWHFWHILGV